jgi:uncharacterized protein YecT (DUF1311 family)
MFKLFVLVLFLVISKSSIAQDCANAENTLAIVDCHTKRYETADKELNALYSKAIKSLSKLEQEKLKSAQKAWLTFRDTSFTFVIEANKENGSYGNIVISDYKAKFVEKRVLELKYLLSSPEDSPVAW